MKKISLLILGCLSSNAFSQEVKFHSEGNAIEAQFIYINGEIKRGLTKKVNDLFVEKGLDDGTARIVLNSPGGNLDEGLRLGYWIREKEFNTEVGTVVDDSIAGAVDLQKKGKCYSACALAFLGGVYRYNESVPFLGFHRFYKPMNYENLYSKEYTEIDLSDVMSKSQITTSYIVKYMIDMGVDARIVYEYRDFGENDLKFFTKQEAEQYNIINDKYFSDWSIEPYNNAIVATSKVNKAMLAYRRVSQITTYCKIENGEKTYRLLLTAPFPNEISQAKKIAQNGGEINYIKEQSNNSTQWESVPVSPESINTWVDKNYEQHEFILPKEAVEILLNKESVNVQIDTSRVEGIYAYGGRTTPKERELIKASFTHCITK